MGLFVLIKLGAVTIVTKGFALLSICVPIHPPPSLPAFFSSGWNRTSLLLRLLPLFLLVPFLLPLVWRSRQSALIRDCAAQPSASRGCWESMARLQDPCALAGDKWKHNRESWGGGGLCHSCSGSHWLSVSLTPSHCWREKKGGWGWQAVCLSCGCKCEWEDLGDILAFPTLQPPLRVALLSLLGLNEGLNSSFLPVSCCSIWNFETWSLPPKKSRSLKVLPWSTSNQSR